MHVQLYYIRKLNQNCLMLYTDLRAKMCPADTKFADIRQLILQVIPGGQALASSFIERATPFFQCRVKLRTIS